jgi:cellulose synthase/poly-beta-1,6-N-acetylglucosamine synthase-like glycosyltransferase
MIIVLIYFLLLFFFLSALLILALKETNEPKKEVAYYPIVSVLVAARNEEKNIVSCLKALSKINYPKDRVEILIGNDQSNDGTEKLTEEFIKDKNNFRLINITSQLGLAKAKANVLAHLAKEAKGEYFFITDADIEVPKGWIQGLLKHADHEVAIVSGVTVVEGKTLFAKLQGLDWLLAFGMVKTVSDLGIPVTAVGNNMMISREAYEAVGGYEKVPFSVTEDYELFKQVLKKGYKYKNLMNEEVLAISKPAEDFNQLIKQRKRWMRGAVDLPKILVLCLFIKSIFLPFIIIAMIMFPIWGALLWMSKILLQQVFMALVMRRINLWSGLLKYFILFEVYSGLLPVFMLFYYALPTKVVWKGRVFK